VENNMTQEKLVIKDLDDHVTISRYPMTASVEWINEMEESVQDLEEERNNGDQKRKIELNLHI
jgi:polyhydroxyalkanoate synthesis regulator phasin